MKYLAALTLVSLSLLLTLGFMTMPRESHHGTASCVVSVLDKATCSSQSENMALHHIGAYNSFTNILLSFFSLLVLASIFVLVFSVGLLKYNRRYVFVSNDNHISFDPQLRRWLSRFINSPSFK